MKRTLMAFVLIATLACTTPALAHDRFDDDNWEVDSCSELLQLDQHIREGIEHGLSDGSFTRNQARYFYNQLNRILKRGQWEDRHGRFDPDEINDELRDLHDQIHEAHEYGHAQINDDWN